MRKGRRLCGASVPGLLSGQAFGRNIRHMKKTIATTLGLCALLLALPSPAHAQIRIGVGIDIAFPEPPPLVVVSPGIQVVPEFEEEVFFVDGFYWCRRDDAWYRTRDYSGGWAPVRLVVVPPMLVRIPPGHYRHYYRDDDGYWRPHDRDAFHSWRQRHPVDERRAWWHEHRHDERVRWEHERSWREGQRREHQRQQMERVRDGGHFEDRHEDRREEWRDDRREERRDERREERRDDGRGEHRGDGRGEHRGHGDGSGGGNGRGHGRGD